MRPHNLTALKKMEQKPHTIHDSVATQENGLRNLSALREAYPDAIVEDVPGVGRVWVSDAAEANITEFDCAPDQSGLSTFVPYAEAGTIRVYLPSSNPKSRLHVNSLKAMHPELYQRVVEFLKARP